MGRALAVITSPLTLIDRDLGNFVRQIGFTAVGYSLGGPIGGAIGGALAGALAKGGAPKAPAAPGTVSTIRNPTPIRELGYGRGRHFGSKVFFETNGEGATGDVYAFLDDEADGVEQVYLNDDKVTIIGNTVQTLPDNRYQSGLVRAGFALGATPNARFGEMEGKFPGIWTANHRGDGVVTGYLVKNPERDDRVTTTYPQGDYVELSAVFRRTKNVFDPRTGLTGWTENPVLHLMHYLINKRGYDYNRRFLPTIEYWKAAANVCDEAIPLKGGGTEPRYRGAVSYRADAKPKEVIAAILETFDGWYAPRGDGALVIYAGKLYAPTVTIGGDEIVSYNLPYGVGDENKVDQLSVSYISAEHDWSVVETTAWGEPGLRIDPFSPQTPSFSQNRRLAKRQYARINEKSRGTVTTNLLGLKARGHRFINLEIEEGGITFFSGLVEVIGVRRDLSSGGLTIEWVAVDENIDAWNPATEEGEPAALGDRVAPQPVPTPIIDNAVADYAAATDGGTGTRAKITVASPPPRSDYTWSARWRRAGDTAWNEQTYSDVGTSGNVVLYTGFLPAVNGIQLQMQYSTGTGQVSDWSATYTLDARTDTTPPAAATSITLTNWSDTLDLVTDNIARASSYRWRFYAPDGTTLLRTLITSGRSVSYTAQQAAVDGARRDYIVRVAGLNAAGAGGEASTSTITLPAPVAVTGVTAAEDTNPGNGVVNFTLQPNVAGYSVATSTQANFNPLTQGFITRSFGSPTYLQNLAVATYYTKVAAFDGWTDRPDLLNYSTEAMFTTTATSGGSGGSGGGGGGGYCVTTDTPILLADGTHVEARSLFVGDRVWTQHEDTMEWGAFDVTHVEIVDSDDVWYAQLGPNGLKATGDHRVWLSGGWVKMRDIGTTCEDARVVKITVAEAHTYISGGVLSHNIKQIQPEQQ